MRLVALDVTEMPEALDQGAIDAFSAWEPTPSVALARFEDQLIIHRSLCSGYLYFSRSFADRHPDAVRRIVAAQVRALGWLMYEEANLLDASLWAMEAGEKLVGQEIVVSRGQYASLARADLLGLSLGAAVPVSDLAPEGRLFREFEFLQGLGRIPVAVDWGDVRSGFELDLLEHVLLDAQTYQLDTFGYELSGS